MLHNLHNDCADPFALHEPEHAEVEFANESSGLEPSFKGLVAMIEGDRLKDISDLPLDLVS